MIETAPTIIETESHTVVLIPKNDARPILTDPPTNITDPDGYFYDGVWFPFNSQILKAADLWREGRVCAEIAEALGIGTSSDNGQALIGAIRRVCPGLVPPRVAPTRRDRR